MMIDDSGEWHEYFAQAVPITNAIGGVLDDGHGGKKRVPILEVDVSNRPDIADIPRVQNPEEQAVTARAVTWAAHPYPDDRRVVLMLNVHWLIPVACYFRLPFELPKQRQLVETMIGARRIGLAIEPIRDGFVRTEAILVVPMPDDNSVVAAAIARSEGASPS